MTDPRSDAEARYDPLTRLVIRLHDAKSSGDPQLKMPLAEGEALRDALRASAPRQEPASALSPEAERLNEAIKRYTNAMLNLPGDEETTSPEAQASWDALQSLIARLLRSPVASTTLPGEPSEAALAAAAKAVAVNDGWREHSPLTRHVAFAKGALRAAYAVDGSPVASQAPTSLAEIPEAVRLLAEALEDANRRGELPVKPWVRDARKLLAEAARPPKGA